MPDQPLARQGDLFGGPGHDIPRPVQTQPEGRQGPLATQQLLFHGAGWLPGQGSLCDDGMDARPATSAGEL